MTSPDLRAVAARVAARTQLRDVRMVSSEFSLSGEPSGDGQLSYNLAVEPTVHPADDGSMFMVSCTYKVGLVERDTTADNDEAAETPREIAAIEFIMAAMFELTLREGDAPASESELSAYGHTTGALAVERRRPRQGLVPGRASARVCRRKR